VDKPALVNWIKIGVDDKIKLVFETLFLMLNLYLSDRTGIITNLFNYSIITPLLT